jgi:hypothetical protein
MYAHLTEKVRCRSLHDLREGIADRKRKGRRESKTEMCFITPGLLMLLKKLHLFVSLPCNGHETLGDSMCSGAGLKGHLQGQEGVSPPELLSLTRWRSPLSKVNERRWAISAINL